MELDVSYGITLIHVCGFEPGTISKDPIFKTC